MKQRIIWIDYIKAIAITIVIMLHIGVPNPFKTVTRSFIIPLFLSYQDFLALLKNMQATKSFGNKLVFSLVWSIGWYTVNHCGFYHV